MTVRSVRVLMRSRRKEARFDINIHSAVGSVVYPTYMTVVKINVVSVDACLVTQLSTQCGMIISNTHTHTRKEQTHAHETIERDTKRHKQGDTQK